MLRFWHNFSDSCPRFLGIKVYPQGISLDSLKGGLMELKLDLSREYGLVLEAEGPRELTRSVRGRLCGKPE